MMENEIYGRRGRPLTTVDHGDNPYKIPDTDPLLEKLLEEHGDRRYEVYRPRRQAGR